MKYTEIARITKPISKEFLEDLELKLMDIKLNGLKLVWVNSLGEWIIVEELDGKK